MEITALLPLVGVALGWALKSLSDYLLARKDETHTLRRSTFYLLKSYKALLDYDRGTAYFRRDRPPVEQFEPWRAILQARFLEASEANSPSTATAIDLLASVDPAAAIRLHNTLTNIAFVFRRDLGAIANVDPRTYAELLQTQDRLIAFTLSDLEAAALHAAKRAGFWQPQAVKRWIAERKKGSADFVQGMDEQADLRERAVAIPENPTPPDRE